MASSRPGWSCWPCRPRSLGPHRLRRPAACGPRRHSGADPVWMGAVVKVVVKYPKAFWRHDGLAGAAFSQAGPLQEIHDVFGPDGAPAVLLGFTHTGTVGSAAPDFPAPVMRQLAQLFGPQVSRPCTSKTGAPNSGRLPLRWRSWPTTPSSGTASTSARPWMDDSTGSPPRRPTDMRGTSKEPCAARAILYARPDPATRTGSRG
ncbi:FAD-dependent oxidoreductase [Streptomyces andamanensis]|uniref:FAD-dependent oxidoreductase n=1 Tax=Streptomyces andamanensis TaxID=1565035 RepID=A0ABV8TG23_9ACTN